MKATETRSKSPFLPTGRRLAEWSREVWVYALLAGGSVVFLWPFVWMALASVKLDRELFSDDARLLPQQPIPRTQSPYVEERLYEGLKHPRFADVLPMIETALRAPSVTWIEGVDAAAAQPALARGIFKRLTQIAPESWWALPTKELEAKLGPLITPKIIAQTRDLLTRGVVFGQVVLRSYDLQEQVVISPEQTAVAWKIDGPAKARFVTDPASASEGRVLAYDFSTGDRVTLTTTVTAPFPLERLHRLQFFMRPDDSWHALDCTVEMMGRLYRAEHSKFSALADITWQAVWWQPRGPDDESLKEKRWAVLEEIGRGPAYESAPGKMTIRLELRQRGVIAAWWAKIERNYLRVLTYVPFGRYVATSILLVLLQVGGSVFSCSLVAYGFARLRWPGRSACFLVMLGTMMIPSQITMIPQFLVMRELGWYDTLYPLWVPSLFANAFFVFLLHQFMRGIPRDLEDAARIDGCGALRIYWHVILPLIRPSLAAIGIFTFMGVWNDFMGPLVYVNDQRLFPLSLGLYALNVQNTWGSNSMGLMMAGSLLMTLPVIAIFFFAQRYFIQGVTLTGMKG